MSLLAHLAPELTGAFLGALVGAAQFWLFARERREMELWHHLAALRTHVIAFSILWLCGTVLLGFAWGSPVYAVEAGVGLLFGSAGVVGALAKWWSA